MSIFLGVGSAARCSIAATPYTPTGDDEVLETLPRSLLSGRGELASLRRRLADNPRNAELAVEVASRYTRVGGAESDPRYYGYARAALAPWWDSADAPAGVLLLRSKLKERDHQYDAAAADLVLLLEGSPREAQAWVNLANIYRVQGRYGEALDVADRLESFAGPLATVLCRAPVRALTGHAQEAFDRLQGVLPVAREQSPAAAQWVLTVQSEIALALGKEGLAEGLIREGLANDPDDAYLLRAYGDLLIDQGRGAEAVALLRDHTRDNGALLLAAIAARRAGDTELSDAWRAELEGRFEETRLRGSTPHGRFEARHALELRDDPTRALRLALDNWRKQKETRDTRNVLESALAAGDPAAAAPAVDFLLRHGTENVVLQRLVDQLGSER